MTEAYTTLKNKFADLLQLQKIEPIRLENFLEVHVAVAAWLAEKIAHKPGFLLGINGAQGTGKSTFAQFILLSQKLLHNYEGITLSIDDLYLTRAEREHLAREVHPLFQTRGVPGTHDLAIGRQLRESLRQAGPEDKTAIIRFDKSNDERFGKDHWQVFKGRPDFIILEGWCVATQAQPINELTLPVNELEADEDREGSWRHYINEKLQNEYKQFFDLLDGLIFLQVPSFEKVIEWRTLQEQKLSQDAPEGRRLMNPAEIKRFIQHYQRITCQNLKDLPELSDFVVTLDANHTMKAYQLQ